MASNRTIDEALLRSLKVDDRPLTDDESELLQRALSHRSLQGAGIGYERLEFLGDRVLGLIVADMLLTEFPKEEEGAIAKRHAALVRRETLADVAARIRLGDYIMMSEGEHAAGGRENPAILSDVCEAVIAFLYRARGLDGARDFIWQNWITRLESAAEPPRDAKTSLQEWLQGRGRPLPAYRTVGRSGPDHAPVFKVAVQVNGLDPVSGEGRSKRAAEQAAAQAMLKTLQSMP